MNTKPSLEGIKRRIAGKVGKMSKVQCEHWLDRYMREGLTVSHRSVSELTGGWTSCSINSHAKHRVIRRLRKLTKEGTVQ